MVTVNKTRVKKLKDALQAQLNLIAAKYNVEHHELDCESLTAPLPKGRGFLFQGVMPEVH